MFLKNEEFFKVSDSKTVEVTLRFDVDKSAGSNVILRNGYDIIQYFLKTRTLKANVRSVKIQ